jgi:hypothetical protein
MRGGPGSGLQLLAIAPLLFLLTLVVTLLPSTSFQPRTLASLVLYGFVAIQMGWVLRPFVGNPDQPTGFFRAGAWSNAYVEIAELLCKW